MAGGGFAGGGNDCRVAGEIEIIVASEIEPGRIAGDDRQPAQESLSPALRQFRLETLVKGRRNHDVRWRRDVLGFSGSGALKRWVPQTGRAAIPSRLLCRISADWGVVSLSQSPALSFACWA